MFIKTKNAGCFTVIVILLINISIGAWSVSEILSWFGKSIPLIASVIIGLFAGEISIPIAIAGWILRTFGVF
ncbi:hypothetical protein NSB31_29615 [Bacillus cereus]|uniref:hypothetical protein n=1 Tax=Bacillus cereus TaxID=1396 RepID=UPI002149F145|nr:hypothetical protein [Bacillus cereus]MCR2013812.1 hypothetical protein [Bacillus cereus]